MIYGSHGKFIGTLASGPAIALGGATPLITASQFPALNGWNVGSLSSRSGWWGEITRDISAVALSPQNSAFQGLVAALAALYGNRNLEWYLTTGYPFNVISDTTALHSVSTGTVTPVDLTQAPFSSTDLMESWPLTYHGVSIANTGAGGVGVVTGTNFTAAYNGTSVNTWPVQAGFPYLINNALPYYTVATVDSNTQATLTAPYALGSATNANFSGPFNMACPSGMNQDHHQILLTIDSNAFVDKLYEGYNLTSTDGGNTWTGSSAGRWDLVNGTQPPDFTGASSVAGIPYFPLAPNYDEVVIQGVVNHAMPLAVGNGVSHANGDPNGLGSGCFVFPATSTNDYGTAWTVGGLPMGARLRLKANFMGAGSDLETNISSFMSAHPTATQASATLLRAANKHGFILIDWTGPAQAMQITGFYDGRWNSADQAALGTISTSNMELVDTIRPRFTFSGPVPSPAHVGIASTFTLTQDSYYLAHDSNYQTNIYLYWSPNGGVDTYNTLFSNENFATSQTAPGPFQFTWTPPSTGTFSFIINFAGQYWTYAYPFFSFTVSS